MEPIRLVDLEPDLGDFRADVVAGLSKDRKTLPCKYLYDERGSKIFDEICEAPEYYPTRTELRIMRENMREIAQLVGPQAVIIEPGSGSGLKTQVLLDSLDAPAAYVPVEISREHLINSANEIAAEHPELEVLPVCADFTQPYEAPEPAREWRRRLVYFPGSTIGNFFRSGAADFLAKARKLMGDGGAILIGVDLKKDPDLLKAAYNDSGGVTSDFNMNYLRRINNALDADFDLDAFHHEGRHNVEEGRIEMHLVSDRDQTVTIAGKRFKFTKGETIWTESSHKYTLEGFAELAAGVGLKVERAWTDERRMFSLQYLVEKA